MELCLSGSEPSTPKIMVYSPMDDQMQSSQRNHYYNMSNNQLSPPHSRGSSTITDDNVTSESCSDDNFISSCDSLSDESDNQRQTPRTKLMRRIVTDINTRLRSLSLDSTRQRAHKKTSQQKSILRPPTRYTYLKGPSGLPTQRVPLQSSYPYVS